MQAPKRLKKLSKHKWDELSPLFALSNSYELEIMAQACEQWANYMACQKDVDANGPVVKHDNGTVGANSAIKSGKDAITQMHKLLALLKQKDATEQKVW
jgi:P27 family predicted phage terminase small subunit